MGVEKTMGNGTVRKILMAVLALVFLFSGSMVLRYQLQQRAVTKQAEEMGQWVVTLPVERTEKPAEDSFAEAPVQQTPDTPEQETPQEEIAETAADPVPIRVDFEALRAKNPDVVAWIYCPDTPINYPVVQSTDNDYYLRRLLDGSKNSSGTLFLDYRNAADLTDWNSVIYGHNMKNESMFGTLPNYSAPAYAREHPVIYLLTPERNYAIRLLAGFVTAADDELYNALSAREAEQAQLLEQWLAASDFDAGIVPAAEDRLVTLSTCSYAYQDARYVLIGILCELD